MVAAGHVGLVVSKTVLPWCNGLAVAIRSMQSFGCEQMKICELLGHTFFRSHGF